MTSLSDVAGTTYLKTPAASLTTILDLNTLMTCSPSVAATSDIDVNEKCIRIPRPSTDVPLYPDDQPTMQYVSVCHKIQNKKDDKALDDATNGQLESSSQSSGEIESGDCLTETYLNQIKEHDSLDQFIKEETVDEDDSERIKSVNQDGDNLNESGSALNIDSAEQLLRWGCDDGLHANSIDSVSIASTENYVTGEGCLDVPVYNGRNQCIVCLAMFDTYYALRKHKSRAHGESREHKCPICPGVQLYKMASLANHVKSHSVLKPYICGICGSTFSNKRPLYKHMAQIHTEQAPLYNCSDCGKHFNMLSNFRRHVRIHSGEKPFSCQICGKTFNSTNNLRRHVKIHFESTDMPYECKICQKPFAQRTDLDRHQRIHSGDRPYACHFCTKRFRQNSHLQRHVAMHSSLKPFRCDKCRKGFREVIFLEHHKTSHVKSPPYTCSVCRKEFQSDANLQAHLKIHSSERRFSCQVCDMHFKRSCHLQVHMRKHTGEKPYHCEVCGKSFTQATDLKRHQNVHVHTYTCGVCRAGFGDGKLLESHLEMHTVQSSDSWVIPKDECVDQ